MRQSTTVFLEHLRGTIHATKLQFVDLDFLQLLNKWITLLFCIVLTFQFTHAFIQGNLQLNIQ